MKERTRKIFIMIVMAALIVSLMAASFAALTYGRYSGGRRDENSAYEDILDLVGETAFEVSTADELVNAINNGYAYIKIADDAEEPFVINNNVADVYTNLVLDVNGHVVVRNSRNPLLDVRRSISVVLVYDSSTDADGGFYNPVGSSLQTSGGTLTVGEGIYESGPKADTASSVSGNVSATVYSRDNRTQKQYTLDESTTQLPKLEKDVYLENEVTEGYLRNDTYLLYTVEKNGYEENGQLYVNAKKITSGETTTISAEEFSPICNVASCDFYYYYPVGEKGTENSPQTYAVIYGYNDVKALARNEKKTDENGNEYGMASDLTDDGLVWPYAAIRSVEDEDTQEGGVTHARGGVFKTHFGEENTYCIYSAGGTMTVGTSGSDGGPTFDAVGSGVCIAMTDGSENASEGVGGSLTISGGTFSSEVGNTIEMEGGNMTVTAGTFKKNAADAADADPDSTNNGSAISISGGTLNMAGTGTKTFIITGNYVNGIRVQATTAAATATIEHAAFNFNESGGSTSVAGVRSFGGDLTVTNSTFNISNGATSGVTITNAAGLSTQGGTVTAESCKFNFAQDASSVSPTESAGIFSSGGTVTATDCAFTIPGNNNYGIYSSITGEGAGEGKYDTTATDCTFTMTGNSNHGIYAAGGKTLASGGTYTIGSGSGQTENFGIQVSSGSVALEGVKLDVYGERSSCVYAVGGTISLSGENAVNMHFLSKETTISSTAISTEGGAIEVTGGSTSVSSDALGITARQKSGNEGSISIKSGAEVTVGSEDKHLPVTGVYVNGGKIENKGTLTVFSTINNGFYWNEPNKYNGVYVNGGSLVSNGTLNVEFTGVQNESHDSYDALKIRSYAVRVEEATGGNSEVSIADGTISNSVGGGVYVGGGTVTLGDRGKGGPAIGTTGVSFGDENTSAGGGNWKYYENKTGGHAVEVNGGNLLVYDGLYTAALGNGILVRGGNAWILDGIFQGNDTGVYRDNYGEGNLPAGPAAYYALKLLGGSVTTFGGTFGTYTADDNTEHTAGGSSAFVTGVSSQATANIYGGSFVVSGQAGFSVYQNVALTFTPKNKITVGEDNALEGSDVKVSAATTAIAIENTTNAHVSVTINGGTFESTLEDSGQRDGIWDSNPYAKLTINQLEGQTTTISALAKHGINLVDAPAIENRVTITGGTITGKQDGIYYGSNGTAANGLLISGGTITGSNGSGLNLVGAPAASGAVTISGGTITGSNHGVYYGTSGAVNDGLLIEGGTITGSNGSGLYFAVNPWQNGGTNNVAIVGGIFKGNPTKINTNENYYINGAISAPSTSSSEGLGRSIRLGDILKTHTEDGKVACVSEDTDWHGDTPLGDNYDYSIAVTVSSLGQVTIIPYNQ